ncbi:Beta,beta-carotene [Armadillidium nasatum]|uniref:Beta,beta-carotene n=1 Tax=Armadillidium nasatum TaxID=96803 RepID=A0A5N5TMP6_9CRUS|nr:Beta,beta-carotene [Armadillidium nasatum]
MELFSQNFVNATEQITPVKTTVKGNLPSWLRGDLIRVTFCKRFVESDAYKKAHKAGRPVYTEFGTKAFPDPTKSLFSRLVSSFVTSNMKFLSNYSSVVKTKIKIPAASPTTQACNIMRIEDEIFVSSETCYMRRIEQNTLDTKEKVDMHKIAGTNFASSHVITDDTGTSYNIGFTIFSGPKYHIMKRSPSNNNTGKDVWLNTRCITTLPSSWKASYSYVHSFGLTENYLVFLEQPLLVNVLRLATSQVKGRSLNDCLEWHPQELVKFIIVNKKTGEVVKTKYISDEPFLVMHHVNAYEVKGQLVVDFVAYPNCDIIEKLYLEKDVQEGEELVSVPNCTASAVRARKDSKGDFIQVSGMEIGETGMDMPTFNNERRCKPYRYVYGNGGFDQGYYKNAVCKIDTETGLSQIFKESEYQYPSEPIFVPRPFAAHEEDGVVLVSMVETRKDHPHALVVLDAQSFTEIARIETNEPIPTSLHGIFVPDGSGGY